MFISIHIQQKIQEKNAGDELMNRAKKCVIYMQIYNSLYVFQIQKIEQLKKSQQELNPNSALTQIRYESLISINCKHVFA